MKHSPLCNRLIAVSLSTTFLCLLLITQDYTHAQDGTTYLPLVEGFAAPTPTTTPTIEEIVWDGGGDGSSWADTRNWDAGRLPTSNDHVLIPAAPGRTVIITDSVDIAAVQSDAALILDGGQLLVRAASTVNNHFLIAPEGELYVDGVSARFTVNGSTQISGTVWALDGGQAILPNATLLDGNTDDYAELMAIGEGSVIDLSSVVTIFGNTRIVPGGSVGYFLISAIGGAHIDLSSLTAIPSGRILATATGKGSRLDFAQLADLGDRSKLEVADWGQVFMPRAKNLDTVSLSLSAHGMISTTQVMTLTRAFVAVTGETLHFPNVQNADAGAFAVSDGGMLTFPALTSYAGTENAVFTEWAARDTGSRLLFPALRTLSGNRFINSALLVTAKEGGYIELPQLNLIDGGKVEFVASGAESEIHLPSLMRFLRSGRGRSAMTATQEGRILAPNLVELTGVALTVGRDTAIDTSQILTFASGRIDVVGVTADFANLAHVDGASLWVRDGGTLALPRVTSYTANSLDFFPRLRAEDAGSLLELSNLTNLVGAVLINDALLLQAKDGGELRLPGLSSIEAGIVQIEAEGIGSHIDLTSLADFRRVGSGLSSVRAGQLSTIDFGDNSLRLQGVDLFVESHGVYTLTSLLLDDGARLIGDGRFPAPVTNHGEVVPSFASFGAQDVQSILAAGTLEIGGAYTQTLTGTLTIEIAGPLPVDYDRLVVTSPVQLGGTLALRLLGLYDPEPGATFTILTGALINGVFDEVTGAEIDENRYFKVSYSAENVVVTIGERLTIDD